MGHIVAYSLNVALLLMAMYLIYKWVLASEKMFAFNRAIILAIYGISLAFFPIMSLISSHDTADVGFCDPTQALTLDQLMTLGEYQTPSAVAPTQQIATTPMWAKVIVIIYLVGLSLLLLRSCVLWIKLLRTINSGKKQKCGNYTLVIIDNQRVVPFSWLRYIVMSQSDFDSAGEMIINHETRHLECRHWIDMLLTEAMTIFNWFNPAAWLLKEELKTVHEYQADMAVLNSGINAKEYQLLLIKKAVGARFPSFANSLNHSKLKKRITMMLSSQSSKRSRLRALALAPALAVAVLILNQSAIAAVLTEISASELSAATPQSESKDNQKISIDSTTITIVGDSISTNTATTGVTTYYINGNEVTKEQLDATDPSTITSMNVNRNDNVTTVHVTTGTRGNSASSSSSSSSTTGTTHTSTTTAYSYKAYQGSLEDATYIIDRQPATAMQWVALSDEAKERSIVIVEDGKISVVVNTQKPEETEITYIVNGEVVSAEQARAISPNLINSMSVDKSNGNNTVIITLKK